LPKAARIYATEADKRKICGKSALTVCLTTAVQLHCAAATESQGRRFDRFRLWARRIGVCSRRKNFASWVSKTEQPPKQRHINAATLIGSTATGHLDWRWEARNTQLSVATASRGTLHALTGPRHTCTAVAELDGAFHHNR
jgi:hypothetical protein